MDEGIDRIGFEQLMVEVRQQEFESLLYSFFCFCIFGIFYNYKFELRERIIVV